MQSRFPASPWIGQFNDFGLQRSDEKPAKEAL